VEIKRILILFDSNKAVLTGESCTYWKLQQYYECNYTTTWRSGAEPQPRKLTRFAAAICTIFFKVTHSYFDPNFR